jgi:hypothetical protein
MEISCPLQYQYLYNIKKTPDDGLISQNVACFILSHMYCMTSHNDKATATAATTTTNIKN